MILVSLRGSQLVDRSAFLLNACLGKRVLHLGATDAPCTLSAIRAGRFLHSALKDVAADLVGMDNNWEMIKVLCNEHGVSDIRYGDIEVVEDYPRAEFDVVVAGEILEHLSNPGRALDALRAHCTAETRLIVTVPNAYSLKGFLRAMVGHELIHPDHILHHSLRTLSELLRRHGFQVERIFAFVNGGSGWRAAFANRLLRVLPQLAEGIGVVCRISEADR